MVPRTLGVRGGGFPLSEFSDFSKLSVNLTKCLMWVDQPFSYTKSLVSCTFKFGDPPPESMCRRKNRSPSSDNRFKIPEKWSQDFFRSAGRLFFFRVQAATRWDEAATSWWTHDFIVLFEQGCHWISNPSRDANSGLQNLRIRESSSSGSLIWKRVQCHVPIKILMIFAAVL